MIHTRIRESLGELKRRSLWDEDLYLDMFYVVSVWCGAHEWSSNSYFGSIASTEPIEGQLGEFISWEITHNISDWTLVVSILSKEGNLGYMDGYLGAFWAMFLVGKLGAHLEPKTCGSL